MLLSPLQPLHPLSRSFVSADACGPRLVGESATRTALVSAEPCLTEVNGCRLCGTRPTRRRAGMRSEGALHQRYGKREHGVSLRGPHIVWQCFSGRPASTVSSPVCPSLRGGKGKERQETAALWTTVPPACGQRQMGGNRAQENAKHSAPPQNPQRVHNSIQAT